MVNHDITNRITTKGIITTGNFGFSTTKTHVTYYNIVCIYPKRFSGNTHPITRSCLPGNSNIRSTNYNRCFQTDNTCYIKNNDTSSTHFTSFAERARSTIIQIGYSNYLTTTTTITKHTASFCTRKCRDFSLRQIVRTGSPRYIRTSFFGFFLDNR